MIKKTHHGGYDFPDHQVRVRSIGQPDSAPQSAGGQYRAPYDRAYYAALKADKEGTRARIAANRAKALPKTTSKREGASHDAYDFDLDSSALSGGTYDPKTKELTLDFIKKTAGPWSYVDVPRRIVQQLRTADSAGEFMNDEIRGVYEG